MAKYHQARHYRVFGGKRYELEGNEVRKSDALTRAAKLRRGGKVLARVVSGNKPYYHIYVRTRIRKSGRR